MWPRIILYLCCVVAINLVDGKSKLVNIAQGPVRGYLEPEGIFAFYGIPYATTPTGQDKFKAPLPPPTWSEPMEAVDKGIACPQKAEKLNKPYKIEQDCLIVNVFVPDIEVSNMSVVVYIHGGAYQKNFGNYHTPKHAVSSANVVVVTFNYRLGVLGFLCLETEGAPGNAGLKDQVAALQWVNKNIAAFGGNPNDVTLAGYSSGSICVDILALSPATDGLINKVIIDTVVNFITPSQHTDPLENARIYASHLGFNDSNDIHALEKFYTSTSTEILTNGNATKYLFPRSDFSFLFSPCVEQNHKVHNINIFTQHHIDILKKGAYKKLPMLFSFSNTAGWFSVPWFDEIKKEMNENFSNFLPRYLSFKTKEEKEAVAKKIRIFYFDGKSVSEDNILKYIEYYTDFAFMYPMLKAMKMHVEAGHDKIYWSEYVFVDETDLIIPHTNVRGADHSAQSYSVLDGKTTTTFFQPNETKISDDFKKMKKIMRSYWANFVKSGSPVPPGSDLKPWPPVVGSCLSPHMEMSLPPRLQWELDNQLQRRIRFWDNLYDAHFHLPVPRRPKLEVTNSDDAKSMMVNIAQGPVRGYLEPEGVFAFYGIPYATAPTGQDKFKAPLPPPTWSEPMEAVDKCIACPQKAKKLNKPYRIVEDCLVINLFIPDTEASNLSVVVYIHGGGFLGYFGNYQTPKHVVRSENVIVATFNYRLGVLGFLCLGTEDAPGNAALKDQVAALQWVNKNIAAFGGNPNDVTLAGYSAGSVCVDILALSPVTDGLFNKVISDSVVSLINPLMNTDPLENARIYAAYLGFNDTGDIYALEKFYKSTSTDMLTNGGAATYLSLRSDSTFLFSPCIENIVSGRDTPIITQPPNDILKAGTYKRLPTLFAFANMEGLLNLLSFFTNEVKMNENFSDFLPGNLKFKTVEEKNAVAKQVMKLYFGDEPVSKNNIPKYIDYFSEIMFIHPMFKAIEMRLKSGHNNLYWYEYVFMDETDVIPYTNVRGADHCAETYAVLDGKTTTFFFQPNETKVSGDLKEMKGIMRTIWANFVKTGSPVPPGSDLPPWPPVEAPCLAPHMEMSLTPRLLWEFDDQLMSRIRFWDNLYATYYRTPMPPRPMTKDSRR